ncbi:MAG: hypothetical protein JRJ49_01200 [Deltaproteobacteria bacterium]|nr:hypothetical protein [Deltaproteobacteria bacterium]
MADINDLVLIYFENEPITFARIEDIQPDIKKNWYHISLLFLQNPLHIVTWILKNEYINGAEFSMSDKKIRIEKVESPYKKKGENPPEQEEKQKKEKTGKLLFLNSDSD